MTTEKRPDSTPAKTTDKQELNLDILPSAQKIEGEKQGLLGNSFSPKIVERGPGKPPVKISGAEIEIDRSALEQQTQIVKDRLLQAIKNGDENTVNRYLWYLEDRTDPEGVAMRDGLTQALKEKNAANLRLDALTINLPHRQMAERELIKKALREDMSRLPFTYINDRGEALQENELDYVMVESGKRKMEDGFIIMVGSKKGISAISALNDLPKDKFQPEKDKITKDPETGTISVPLMRASDGTESPFVAMEIYKVPVDIQNMVYEEEAREIQSAQSTYSPNPNINIPTTRSKAPTRSVHVSY